MESLILLTISASAFIATNLDDLFILVAFFSSKNYPNTRVVLGQYLGFCTLILVSIMASFINLIFPPALISLLGLLPILIGLKNFVDIRNNQQSNFKQSNNFDNNKKGRYPGIKVAMVTLANGGDNLGVYIPLMASVNAGDMLAITSVFLIFTGIWCLLSYMLVYNRFVGQKILNYGHLILPFVLIGIGMIILVKGGGISLLANIF